MIAVCKVLGHRVKISFGEWFYLKRKRANLSQGDIARALDIKPQSIGNWENGRSVPTLNPLQMNTLCKLMNVTLDEMADAMEVETNV